MQPQFQSSFIPKGASAPASSISTFSPIGAAAAPSKHYSLIGILGGWIFTIALLLTGGLFGYKWYLNRQINQMSSDLDAAEQSLQDSAINDLTLLNARLTSTKGLIASHTVITPFFEFLEHNTLQNVSFGSFSFTSEGNTSKVTLKGSAHGYSAVALQSQQFNAVTLDDKPALTDITFSDLDLDDEGDVTFSVAATVNPKLLSYAQEFPAETPPPATSPTAATTTATSTTPSVTPTATSTATSTASSSAGGSGTSCKDNDFTCIVTASKSCSLATMTNTASSTTTRYDVLGKSGAQCHSRTIYIEGSDLQGKINDCTSATSDLTGYLTAVQKGTNSSAADQFLSGKCKLVSA